MYRVLGLLLLLTGPLAGSPFSQGEGIPLEGIPVNERGIIALTAAPDGTLLVGTTGRAAHVLRHDPASGKVEKLASFPGGVGVAYQMPLLPDGSLIVGTQADPTGLAAQTDPGRVGRLYRLYPGKKTRVEDLGVPVEGQGIHALAYLPATEEILGLTWPDGHFFTVSASGQARDLGAIAGYRTYEIPRYADKLNQGTTRNLRYARQVSRVIAIDPASGAYTAGKDGLLYHYSPSTRKIEPLKISLPAIDGREPWTSLDAACLAPARQGQRGTLIVGGTSGGYLVGLHVEPGASPRLSSWGKPLGQNGIQGLTCRLAPDAQTLVIDGVGGPPEGMPRAFRVQVGASFAVEPGGIPYVDGKLSMAPLGAMLLDGKGGIYAGESDRIARLVRFPLEPGKPAGRRPARQTEVTPGEGGLEQLQKAPRLPFRTVFAPEGTTTEASGYTALEVGKDGQVYVGSARYGGYAWLMRFPGTSLLKKPSDLPLFMDKVVGLRDLSGESREGINTQGKIHAKILVGADGKVWFATKQAHEVFATRPEYGDMGGYPGGHLCYYDPKTGFSRSLGILLPQEGLMAGALDDQRAVIYYRSEPKNLFLAHDLKTRKTRLAGHTGDNCRYMAIDSKGAVYSLGRGQTLTRYDPETGYVEDLRIVMDNDGSYTAPYVLLLGPNGKLYGTGFRHPWIIEYDIEGLDAQSREVRARNVAGAAPPGLPSLDVHAGVFGQDGKLYYPLVTSDPAKVRSRADHVLAIMRFDPQSKRTEIVGVPEVEGLDEDKVRHTYIRETKYGFEHMQGAAVGPDGTLYLMDIYPQLNIGCFPGLTAKK